MKISYNKNKKLDLFLNKAAAPLTLPIGKEYNVKVVKWRNEWKSQIKHE